MPTITKPSLHMAVNTRTGTGAAFNVTGVGFQPDLVISKGRSGATGWVWSNSVVGTGKYLSSNSTAAEVTDAQAVTAFNSDGFSGGTAAILNTNAATYVDYMFKGGGAAVSNTSGSITSSVSANTTAGISIVTYTGTGANATVGHGLGVAPKLIIVRNRTPVAFPSGEAWAVQHVNLTSGAYKLSLNATSAQSSVPTIWNSTLAGATTFSVGTNTETNESGRGMLALCFAEVEGFSKIGRYTGNADANGTFVYCGFEPRWVLVKGSSGTGDWRLYDTARDTYNASGLTIYPNLANGEGDGRPSLDILSNGFKLRLSAYPNNAINFVFIAIAEAPQKYATAR